MKAILEYSAGNFHLLWTLLTIAVVIGAILGICAYLTLLERKVAAWVQDRKGPNRVGPLGLLQPIADGLKFLLKEQVVPKHVDRLFYMLGPSIALTTALIAFAVVPFGPTTPPPERAWPQTLEAEKAADSAFAQQVEEYNQTYQFVIAPGLDIGILFLFALGSLNVYAVILGGWSSDNKYSLLGAQRASAQVISYEIPMGTAIVCAALMTGSLNLEKIINWQAQNGWLIFYQPLAAILFITAVFAECNRLPFDLSECEQELVAGYHTEYSGMKFALFFLGEYTHMITTSFLVMMVFFGGWSFFWLDSIGGPLGIVLKLIIFGVKMFVFIMVYMLIRWTIPRFRFDQLMGLAWKVMIPLTFLQLVAILLVKQLGVSVQENWFVFWALTFIPSVLLLLVSARISVVSPAPQQRRPQAA